MQSIQKRLIISLLIGLPLLWLTITSVTLNKILHEINELNDTQISQVARYLIGTIEIQQNNDTTLPQQTHTPKIIDLDEHDYVENLDNEKSDNEKNDNEKNDEEKNDEEKNERKESDERKKEAGKSEDKKNEYSANKNEPNLTKITQEKQQDNAKLPDAGQTKNNYMGFAIWDKQGTLLMADNNGKSFNFLPNYQGFIAPPAFSGSFTQWLAYLVPWQDKDSKWRVLYVQDTKSQTVIAVGQNLISRREIIFHTLAVQIVPAFLGLLVFIGMVFWLVRQGFARLNPVIEQLDNRSIQDATPITGAIPLEIQPLVTALNQRFIKTAETLAREQRFTADASHELRSPLTAIKLQNELLQQEILHLQLPESAENTLLEQSQSIAYGIQRANHLVEQLLTLAKLEPEQMANNETTGNGASNNPTLVPIDWIMVSDNVLQAVNRPAREKYIQLKRHIIAESPTAILPLHANAVYIEILLRNLLDNAIRYCPNHSVIELILADTTITVQDNGEGVSADNLARLTERFYRPAGQYQQGSGLGLSIVKRITELYGLSLRFENRAKPEQGFSVTIFNSP